MRSVTPYKKRSPREAITREEEAVLVRAAQAGDTLSRQRLIQAHLPFAEQAVRRFNSYRLSVIDHDDLFQEAVLGMCLSIDRFELHRGLRFLTYARFWMVAYMLEHARYVSSPVPLKHSRLAAYERAIRAGKSTEELAEVAKRYNLSETVQRGLAIRNSELTPAERSRLFANLEEDENYLDRLPWEGPLPDAGMQRRDLVKLMDELLTDFEREVLTRRYLEGDGETLKAIGDGRGLSRERVRQVEEQGKKRLRDAIASGSEV